MSTPEDVKKQFNRINKGAGERPVERAERRIMGFIMEAENNLGLAEEVAKVKRYTLFARRIWEIRNELRGLRIDLETRKHLRETRGS